MASRHRSMARRQNVHDLAGNTVEILDLETKLLALLCTCDTVSVQKALPFLENCFVEECSKGNSGTCKLTGHKFAKVQQLSHSLSALGISAAYKFYHPCHFAAGGDAIRVLYGREEDLFDHSRCCQSHQACGRG